MPALSPSSTSPATAATAEPGLDAAAARWAGALFLAAFLLYGVGSFLARAGAEHHDAVRLAVGAGLLAANSAAVVAIARLLTRAVAGGHPQAARIFRTTRGAEALLLAAGGVALVVAGPGHPAGAGRLADVTYLAAMVVLGLGSIPFLRALEAPRSAPLAPRWLVRWGQVGYGLLAAGAVLQLAGIGAALALSGPGGLFELAFGIWLLRSGPQRMPLQGKAHLAVQ